ncbi:hypothetical protein IFO70_35255 [Phormidium tenue FACHB-886]|nr:hypothetical protein [Phormidium tenue FACHB-886]
MGLAEREAQLSSWAIQHRLQHHESLLQLFLEVGLEQDDLNALEKTVCESSTFPELLSFLELMLMTYVLTHQVNLDFQHLRALAKTVAAYRGMATILTIKGHKEISGKGFTQRLRSF